MISDYYCNHRNQAISIFSLLVSIAIIQLFNDSLVILLLLLCIWFFLFKPFNIAEFLVFILATLSIIGQNYSVLKSGGFTFRTKDFLLMPYYEPFLWGFYYLNIKRFVGERRDAVKLAPKAFVGLIITALCFSFFSYDSNLLTIFSATTTLLLLAMFHQRHDLYYAGYALVLGFLVELFGVYTGKWSYPEPDILGIPYWFASMWVSVGLLGRRFLIPVAEWLSKKKP